MSIASHHTACSPSLPLLPFALVWAKKTTQMACTACLSLGALGTGVALAQSYPYPDSTQGEMGRVISSVPIVQQVAVPRQVCSDEQVVVPGQTSGAGAVIGGIAGGAIGNQIGKGSGRAAATALGLIGGALLGNSIEGQRPSHTEMVRQCGTQTAYEAQTIGYTVTYEYAGRQYTTQMAQDPGPWIRLQVAPVGGSQGFYPSAPPSSYGPSGAVTYPVTPPVALGPTTITRETTYISPPNVVYAPPPSSYRSPSPHVSLNISSSRWNNPPPPVVSYPHERQQHPHRPHRSHWEDQQRLREWP